MATQAEVDQQLAAVTANTAKITTVVPAAIAALNGILGLIQKALDDYKAANPTVTDAQVGDLQTAITSSSDMVDQLAAAIPQNTSAASAGR